MTSCTCCVNHLRHANVRPMGVASNDALTHVRPKYFSDHTCNSQFIPNQFVQSCTSMNFLLKNSKNFLTKEGIQYIQSSDMGHIGKQVKHMYKHLLQCFWQTKASGCIVKQTSVHIGVLLCSKASTCIRFRNHVWLNGCGVPISHPWLLLLSQSLYTG